MSNFGGLPIGAICAAFIAAIFSLLGLIIGKENKVSEFRLAWIDALRENIASYVANAHVVSATVRLEGRTVDVWKSVKSNVASLNQSAALIRLRLNPVEAFHKSVLESLDRLEAEFSKQPSLDDVAIEAIERTLLKDARVLLREEWRVVKRGEPVYQRAQKYAVGLAIVCVVVVIYGAIPR